MSETINLARKIEEKLPAEMVSLIRMAARLAVSQKEKLYLVGGAVRDLLLGKTTFDIDLVVEGDAIELAERLTQHIPAEITTHPRFHTAKLELEGKFSIDLTTARKESYAHPGALPTVQPGSLANDLFRRDFTVHAMAISLNPNSYGELIDLHGGKHDLEHKLIRVLHEKSFVDDATRIWRALRYATRFDFAIEANTLKLLKRDIDMLDTISGDRIRYELECVLKEDCPEKALSYACELGALQKVHQALKADKWLGEKFQKARELTSPDRPPMGLYLALMTYSLSNEELEWFISYLRLNKSLAKILRDMADIKSQIASLAEERLSPSQLYHLLHGYSLLAIQAVSLASDSAIVRQHMELYLSKLRYVRTSLNGEDLKKMGIAEGPKMKEILERLLEARLDGKITSRQCEEETVRELKA